MDVIQREAKHNSDCSKPLRLLTFSTLYPHAGRPNHGIFVENRLRHLVGTGGVTSTVIAPVPWFPRASRRFGDWSRHSAAARHETRHGIPVFHPRYILPPKVGMTIAPASIFTASVLAIRRLMANGTEFDVIDGHYLFPDGAAAVALGRVFDKPVVLTARGSDITQYPDYALPRRTIRWAMGSAAALISVSAGLKAAMVQLGVSANKITVLRNGVDLELFRYTDPSAIKAAWGIRGKLLLSVGHLIPRKRHHLAIEAIARLPEWTVAIVGEGPEEKQLRDLAVKLAVEDRVIFCGAQSHSSLPAFYSAADVLILASSREGWANVLLEALACGTAVVASDIPGNAEVIHHEVAGEIVSENTPTYFADAIQRVYERKTSRSATREYAEDFSWDATSQGQLRLFNSVFSNYRSQRTQ